MTRRAISVTLEHDNVTWLRGRAGAVGGSVSGLLDRIVTAARQETHTGDARTVAGTIDIDSSDPLLEQADTSLQAAFDASLGRPLAVREQSPAYQARRQTRKTRG
ncbi:MAG TPA: hypothetical protein VJM31_17920 [Vicinamibacterales bacterium]|nr:hypothetical protein [Vicinamibacterales bacterium]